MTAPHATRHATHIAWVVAGAFFMETLDSTIIVTALPAIASSYDVSTLDASLGVTVYLIAMAMGVPAAGWLALRFGARRVFLAAVAAFTLASLNASPFLLPLMFQIGFGWSAPQAGAMVIAYMIGNLAMKAVTTPILRKFGFRAVLLTNGALCTACLCAMAGLTAQTPAPAWRSRSFSCGDCPLMPDTLWQRDPMADGENGRPGGQFVA